MNRRAFLTSLLVLPHAMTFIQPEPAVPMLISGFSVADSYVTQDECDDYVLGVMRREPITFRVNFL